jgi:hypothetical protein
VMPSRVSLHAEMSLLFAAIEGARILADEISTSHFGTEHDERIAPEAIAAILSLVQIRGADLGRVLRGEKDPSALLGPHNATATSLPEDVAFAAWPPTRRREQALRDRRRAEEDNHPRRKKTKKT